MPPPPPAPGSAALGIYSNNLRALEQSCRLGNWTGCPNVLGWSYGFAGVGRMYAGFLTGMNQLVSDASAIQYNYTVDVYSTLQDIVIN